MGQTRRSRLRGAFDGPTVYVQPGGKDGSVYLVDAAHMGTLYDREQLVEVCGTPEDAVQDRLGRYDCDAAGADEKLMGVPVVIVPTFMP